MRQINVDELASQMASVTGEGITLVDVREPGEFASGHVPGAQCIPMAQLPTRVGDLDRTAPVYVICRSGNRSRALVDVLVAQGFDAVNVRGGTDDWIASGRPIWTSH